MNKNEILIERLREELEKEIAELREEIKSGEISSNRIIFPDRKTLDEVIKELHG